MKQKIKISDGALVRFLERTNAVDVDAIRAQMAAPLEAACTAAGTINVGSFAIKNQGWFFQFRSGHIMTSCYPIAKKTARARKRYYEAAND